MSDLKAGGCRRDVQEEYAPLLQASLVSSVFPLSQQQDGWECWALQQHLDILINP